jgi:hypothetical protein
MVSARWRSLTECAVSFQLRTLRPRYQPNRARHLRERRREMKIYRKVVMLVLIAALPFAGCAAIQRSEAQDTEQLLAAAGFQAKPADTPEKLANLRTMPPRKLVSQAKDGKFVYSYADPNSCQCLYVGGPTEYSAYQRLAVQKEIALDASMDWDTWGPWWW